MATVVALALLSAAAYGVASVLQHRATEHHPPDMALRAGLVLRLARNPGWLAGNLLDAAGFVLQLLALRHGPLTLVEPLLVASLLFALPVAALARRQRVPPTEMAAAVAVAGGLALFLATARPGPARAQVPGSGLLALSGLTAAALIALVLAARRTRAVPTRSGLLLAAAGGISFGYMAAATSLGWEALGRGALHALTSWEPYAVLVSGAAGILLTQSAFSSGAIQLSLPTLTVVQPLVAVAIGLLLLGERIDGHGLAPLWEVVGLVVSVGGVFALARPEFGE